MTYNIANLPPEERARLAREREEALARHKANVAGESVAEREFQRILAAKSEKKKGWRDWVLIQLGAIEEESVRQGVRKRLNEWLERAGQ